MPYFSSGLDLPDDSLAVDLHLHSNASDGEDPPRRVMERAKAAGLRVVSLTDHDTVAGLDEARRESGRLELEFVDGVELSSIHRGRIVHMLGHFIRPADPELSDRMRRYMGSRKTRVAEMIGRLGGLGISIDPDDFFREYGGAASIGRGQLSAYMLKKNLVGHREEIFEKFLGEEASAYVELDMISPAEAVRLIAGAGGAATFAHPNLSGVDEIIPDLVSAGLAGIEAEHPSQDADEQKKYREMAKCYNLVAMGGSDCHGSRPGPERLGQYSQPVRTFLELRRKASGAD